MFIHSFEKTMIDLSRKCTQVLSRSSVTLKTLNDLGKPKDHSNVSNAHETNCFQRSAREAHLEKGFSKKKQLSSSPNQYSMYRSHTGSENCSVIGRETGLA